MRRLLRGLQDDRASPLRSAFAERLRRAFQAGDVRTAFDLAALDALRDCSPSRRAVLAQALASRRPTHLSARTYYRAKKQAVERLAETISIRLKEFERSSPGRPSEPTPIALPMVDRLTPEPIGQDRYRGPDRGRALSAAALCAEMSGEQQRADTLISAAADNVRNQFGCLDVACAFEVAQNQFFIARCRGDVCAMRAALRTPARLYDRLSHDARLKFSLDCSEVYLYEGRLREAHAELKFALLDASRCSGTLLQSIALVRKAQVALAFRDMREAEAAARAAADAARPHADIRVYAAEVLGRLALRTGRAWSSEGLEQSHSVFHALSVKTMLARHQANRLQFDAACQTAADSYEAAMALRYWNLASRSASTLAFCLPAQESQAWLARAVRLYLTAQKQNVYFGDDLFDCEGGGSRAACSFLQTDDALRVIGQTYLERFPNSMFAAEGHSVLRRLTRFILQGALDTNPAARSDSLASVAARCLRHSFSSAEIEREVRRVGSFIGALAVLLPLEQRTGYALANRRRTLRAQYAVRRSFARYHWNALRG